MSVDSDFSAASIGAPDGVNPGDLFSDHPSYMIAADAHTLGNNQGSMFDPSTWGDKASSVADFAMGTAVRAVTSAWNTVPEVGNLLGGDFDSNKLDTEQVLRGFDDNLGDYYVAHKSGIDITGDVIGSLAPGLGGIKVLNWGQKALRMVPEGTFGFNIAKAIGTLPDMQATYAAKAVQAASQTSGTFSWVSGNVIKSVATGYAQNALEFGMFQAAAAVTMRNSPLFDKDTPTDILYNAVLGGGLVGGGIMGSIAAARTYGAVRAAGVATDAALASSRTVLSPALVASPSDKIIAAHVGIDELPVISATDPLAALKTQVQEKTTRVQNNLVRTSAIALSGGDSELGNTVANMLHGTDAPTVMQGMLGSTEAGRIRDVLDAEKEYTVAAKASDKALVEGTPSSTVTPPTIRYLKLTGEDAGTMDAMAPKAAYLGDSLKSVGDVNDAVKGYKFNATKPFNILADDVDHTTTEARTIWADTVKLPEDMTKLSVDKNDIPLLERLYKDKVPAVTLTDGTVIGANDMQKYLVNTKLRVAKIISGAAELTPGAKELSTQELAKFVNVKTALLEGTLNTKAPMTDYLAMQSTRQDASDLARAKGVTLDPAYVADTYHLPQYAKLSYDTDTINQAKFGSYMDTQAAALQQTAKDAGYKSVDEFATAMPDAFANFSADYRATHDVNDSLINGITYIKQLQIVNQASSDIVTAKYFGDLAPNFEGLLSDKKLATANRLGVGAKLFAQSDGGYVGVGADCEYLGAQTHTLIGRAIQTINDTFSSHFYKMANDATFGNEVALLRQNMLSTPEKYILQQSEDGGWEVANRKIAEWENNGSEGAAPEVDQRVATNIPVSSDAAAFLTDWINHNDTQLNSRYGILTAQGKKIQDLTGNVYFPQPDARNFPHFAMVIDPAVTSTGHKSLITAADEVTLQAQVAKVQAQFPELKVLYKSELDARKVAAGDYDYDQGINDNYVDIAKLRSGVAPFFPRGMMDGTGMGAELTQWRIGSDTNLARDMVALKNERAFTALQRMGKQETLESTSTFGAASTRKYAQDTIADPYNNYVKTALDISTASEYKRWNAVNQFAENAVSGLVQKVVNMWQDVKTPNDLEPINAAIKEAGINTNFEDSMSMAFANHSAPKPYLSNFIRTCNSVLSTLMLKADPGNAINNGMGNLVLTGAETSDLVRKLPNLFDLADGTMKIPGTGDVVISPLKLMARAYGKWFKLLAGNPEMQGLRDTFESNSWMMTMHDEVKGMIDSATLKGGETAEMLYSKQLSMITQAGDFMSKWTGNNWAEQMSRFTSASIAQDISQIGVDNGALSAAEQRVFINSFVNRSQGNYLASQRPIAFQGPIGQAIGLFQTYQFNMMNTLFRHVADGDTKTLATLLALQGSIYGINGMPAINAINDHIIGNAAGNPNHSDIFSTVGDTAGKEAGDWLMYGISSNFLLAPDLKMNLYSRGDINPRQVTVLPTQLSDVPIVSAAASFFTSLKNTAERINQGGNVYTSVLQGIEHAGLNRPLAGLATTLEGASNGGTSYSTTQQGQLIMSTDMYSLTNLARLAGAKPLDESVARDAMYRTKVYAADRSAHIETIGAAIKGKIMQGDNPSADEVNGFLNNYVNAGGQQANFNKWIGGLMMQAKTSQVNKLSDNLKNPFSQYMQKVMGGYNLEDMNNTPAVQP